ncbi:MAG: hypothetical protein J5940_06745 [Clostridia bacterium]|nr:hypothetical protein [Clostridia bacterium]
MLIIKPIQEKERQRLYAELCGVVYREEDFAYSADVDGKPVGICQFAIKGESGYIHDIENAKGEDDADALFIMGRAVLNFVNLCGCHDAFAEKETPMLKRIGFRNRDGVCKMTLDGFFEAPCEAEKKLDGA